MDCSLGSLPKSMKSQRVRAHEMAFKKSALGKGDKIWILFYSVSLPGFHVPINTTNHLTFVSMRISVRGMTQDCLISTTGSTRRYSCSSRVDL